MTCVLRSWWTSRRSKGEVYNALRSLNYPGFSEANVYDAVWDVLDRIQELEGRTAVVLVSTGLDTFSKKNLGETLKRVKSSTAPIYSVALGGNLRARYEHLLGSTDRMDFLQADSTLKSFAKFTGGEAFFPRFNSQFGPIFNTISLLLRNQYSVSYVSTNPKRDGKFRKIQVKVTADLNGDGKNDKVKVNHRSGYLAAKGS